MSSKKTVLKVTPNAPASSQQRSKRKSDLLRECINAILKRELLHLNVKKVFDILVNDLHINLKNVPPRMKYILSECLCYYMKMWPGWQQYETVCTNERLKMEYIEKFKEFLKFKINYIIENDQAFSPEIRKKRNVPVSTKEVQTEPINKKSKPEAPYNLVISGQPNVLNNIVFIEMDNNIVIKQHAEKPWKPLNVAEFLNYSFVKVSIKLPDLELSRSNLHEFQRYITECGDVATSPEVDFIAYIRKLNSNKPKVYTMDYIHAYFKQFIEIIGKITGINMVKRTELEEVFRQFILDIQDSNVFSCSSPTGTPINTMATNTSVCFNIGGRTYIRNKKMVVNNENQKETNAINFCEVLIPRMAYTLNKFTAEEDMTPEDTSFKSLNEIKAQITKNTPELLKFTEAVNTCITYQCLLCPKIYTGDRAYIDILDHYRFLHKGEQSVLCFTCRKQFVISRLAGLRWSHECVSQSAEASKESSTVVSEAVPTEIIDITSNSQPTTQAIVRFVPNITLGINQISTNNINTTDTQPILTTPSIGISDILTSTKSTISIDDLLSAQNFRIVPPVISTSNSFSVSTHTSTSANTAIISTLPVVSSLSTSNSVLPRNSVLLAITPSSMATSTVITNPISVNTNANTTFFTTTVRNSAPADVADNQIAVKPEFATVDPVDLKGAVDDISNSDPIYIEDDPLDTNTSRNSPVNVETFNNSSIPTSPVATNVPTLTTTSIILAPVISEPVCNTVPVIVDPNTNSEVQLQNRETVVVSPTVEDSLPVLTTSETLPDTI